MKKQDFLEAIPIAILWLFSIKTLFKVASTDYIIWEYQYLGIGSLLVLSLLFFTNRRWYRYLLGIVLFAGTLNFIGWTISRLEIWFLGIQFQPLALAISLIFTLIYWSRIERLLKIYFGSSA